MRKIIVPVFVLIILTACSKKQEDFVGVHNFNIMEEYKVRDSLLFVDAWYGRDYLMFKVSKTAPVKIDIFKSGEELKGTYTVTKYQEEKPLITVNNIHEVKSDIRNIHLLNDTLIGEIQQGKKIIEIKLSKNGSEVNLIIKGNENKLEEEMCNKLALINNNNICYKELTGSSEESTLIKESNACAVEKSVLYCEKKGYKKEKLGHLKQILSADPKQQQ